MPETQLPHQFAEYRNMQRTIPGVDGLYAATRAILSASIHASGRILVVGAGGARELEFLQDLASAVSILAVDISAEKLERTKAVMDAFGPGKHVEYVAGPVEAAPTAPSCVGATSLLVMHFLPDDGAKLNYLRSIRSRLVRGAPLVLADVSFNDPADFKRTVPVFLEHARHAEVAERHFNADPGTIPTMPIIGDQRTRELLTQAAFGEVTPFFRSFWYAGWWSRAL